MRPKIVAVILFLALALIAIMVLVERGIRPQVVTPTASDGGDLGDDSNFPKPLEEKVRPADDDWTKDDSSGGLGQAVAVAAVDTNRGPTSILPLSAEDAAAAHEEYVLDRIDELDKLARERTAESLNAILLELENPDKEIRKGALDATVQFRDRSSIPRLQEIAARTLDPEEKAELLEAIEYLKLRTLSERLAERQATTGNGETAPNP